jgi:hypothetical protein
MAVSALPEECWGEVATGCCDLTQYPKDVQDRAIALAVQSLRFLTAYRVGGCPVTVRPCGSPCGHDPDWMHPVLYAGAWLNRTCGCGTRRCAPSYQVQLDIPVGRVDEVLVDGVALPQASYRVDDERWLVRLDGQQWPLDQDLDAPVTAEGTFAVTYLRAYPVDGLGALAAGVLACEFAKACTGSKCALPSGVTQIVRQGISMNLMPGLFPDGMTGLREVDSFIARWNPNRLREGPSVWSPDLRSHRVTTWSAP